MCLQASSRRSASWERPAFGLQKWRWSYSHWRELRPTTAVLRGTTATHPLPQAARKDLDAVTFLPIGGKAPMTWVALPNRCLLSGEVVLEREPELQRP